MKFQITLPDGSVEVLEVVNPEYDFPPLVATILIENKYGSCDGKWGYSQYSKQSGYVETGGQYD